MIFLSAVGLMIHSDPSWRLRPTAPSDSSTPPPWWWASSSALLSSFSPRRSTATSPPFPAFPRPGGVYVFLKETLSPACGFLWGWAMFWSAHSGIIAASSVVLARYVAYFVPLDEVGIRAVAVAAVLLLSFINYLGVRQGSMRSEERSVG